jgi:dephospho-CoA kinase
LKKKNIKEPQTIISFMVSKIIAFVGMPGSGKSEAVAVVESKGFTRIRFGDVTDDEIKKQGLEFNEENERMIREQLRKEHGMDAYAKLNVSKIDAHENVVIDGLYSMEEYLYLKNKYDDKLIVVAIFTPPKIRYERLANRKIRPFTKEESKSRDITQLQNLHTGGPIAMADFTVINEGSLTELEAKLNQLLEELI